MSSPLDRIEASVEDAEDGRWCSLETVDAKALLAAVRAAREPWTCHPECLAFQGYGHREGCVDNLTPALSRLGEID